MPNGDRQEPMNCKSADDLLEDETDGNSVAALVLTLLVLAVVLTLAGIVVGAYCKWKLNKKREA